MPLLGPFIFRLGYYPYWREINACIERLVSACHRYGIRVIEHHSSTIFFDTTTEAGWRLIEENLCVNGRRAYDSWHKIFPFLNCNPLIEGTDIRSFQQVNGKSGAYDMDGYNCRFACVNNPDYRAIYFDYVKSLCDTGIDGIMNDDVQYFDRNACTCEHCRRLFTEQTGYTLPEPQDWGDFWENYDHPVYLAWKRFKLASTERFYRDLTALYRKLGKKLLRPNYVSDCLEHNHTAYPFQKCSDLWNFIFQENCFSTIIKQSWMHDMEEGVHRYALGRRLGIPSMCEFYPDRPDSVYFSWALSRAWGHMYTGTFDGSGSDGL